FMGDVVGRLFREFAVTLAVTIVISAVVSLTLTPMMCSRILRHNPEAQQTRFYRVSERAFERMIAFYGRTLKWVLQYQTLTLLVALATLVLTVLLYIVIPKGFFPTQDTGLIQGVSEAEPSISFAAMQQRQQALDAAIRKDPAVASVSSFIGVDGSNMTLNSGRFLINLKDGRGRGEDVSRVIRRIDQEVSGVEGISLDMQPVQDLTIDATVNRAQYGFVLEDADLDELHTWTGKL